jgi:putative Mg2+ transporter-C (MgtC) family protein
VAATTGWERLAQDFAELGDFGGMALAAVRLGLAAVLGGLLGFERAKAGKAAGLRTHMLVCVGAAFFILGPRFEEASAVSRVIQGIITGIGFLGGGAILKLSDERRIQGLTTAASIWLTAAVGIAVGMGHLASALVSTVLALIILSLLRRLEPLVGEGHREEHV